MPVVLLLRPISACVRTARALSLCDDPEHRLAVRVALLRSDAADAVELLDRARPVLREERAASRRRTRCRPERPARSPAPCATHAAPRTAGGHPEPAGRPPMPSSRRPHLRRGDPPDHVAPQRHLRLAAQHSARRLVHGECAVLTHGAEQPAGEELSDHAAPVLLGEVLADTEGRELIVLHPADALGRGSAQDVDELACAERLVALALQAHDRRHQLLRRDQAVPRLRRFEAGVAVAARARRLAEVVEQVLPPDHTVSHRASMASRCCC